MRSLENDVSADAFPACQRFNPGDAVADITITPNLPLEEKTMTHEILERNLEGFSLFTLRIDPSALSDTCAEVVISQSVFACLLLIISFDRRKFFLLTKSNLSIFKSFMVSTFHVLFMQSLPTASSWRYFLIFFVKALFFSFTFGFMSHLKLVFIYGIREQVWVNFKFWNLLV